MTSNPVVLSTKPQPGAETLDERCQRLQQEWAEAEIDRLSQVYKASARVDQVTGPVRALYYCRMEIRRGTGGCHGRHAMVLSFDVFKAIGAKANIPVSALSRPNVTVRDYSQRPIPIGVNVNLEIAYHGKSVIAPVYLTSNDSVRAEPCLLGTNVVMPLGLMSPANGMEPRRGDKTAQIYCESTSSTACSRPVWDISGRTVTESSRQWLESTGVKVDDSQIHPNAEGLVLMPISNPATEPIPFPVGDSIGQAELLDPEDGARVHQIESSWDVPGEVGAHSVACLEANCRSRCSHNREACLGGEEANAGIHPRNP